VQQHELDTSKASFDRAMTFLRAGDAPMAERICRQALGAFPRDANLLSLLGAAMLKQNRAKEAEHTLSRAVRMYPNFTRAIETLADALIMQGRLPDALEALEQASELEPGNASVRFKKAKVLDGMGRNDEASQQFEASFKLTPHREELVRGLQLQRMGNIREAEKIYRDVLTSDPKSVDALRLLAGVAMRAKQWSDAQVLLERALEIAPDFIQCWMDLGLAHQEQDRTDDALDAFERARRLEPNRPNPYAAIGTTNGMAGRHDDAIKAFHKALYLDEGHATALAGLGHVLKTIGRVDEGIAAYRKCVQHNSWNGEAWWSLANLKTFRFEPEDVAAMEAELPMSASRMSSAPTSSLRLAKLTRTPGITRELSSTTSRAMRIAASARPTIRYKPQTPTTNSSRHSTVSCSRAMPAAVIPAMPQFSLSACRGQARR